jgi:hypothetical protein
VDHEDSEEEAADPEKRRGRVRWRRRRRMRKELGVAGFSVHALLLFALEGFCVLRETRALNLLLPGSIFARRGSCLGGLATLDKEIRRQDMYRITSHFH